MKKVGWILDADIKGFFDTISHEKLMELIGLGCLKTGNGRRRTPQGAVISPLLAKIYLHYVVDQWVMEWRRVQTKGDLIIVRYTDDLVLGFQSRWTWERLETLMTRYLPEPKTLHPYPLDRFCAKHPDKSRVR